MMNFSIVYGKDNNTDENDDSGCGLCSNNLGKNETGLEIQWEYSEYVYGALPSIFCLDCCIPNFPVEVLQACTRTRMRYNRHLDSYGMNFGIYGAEERVSEPDKLDSIREKFSIEKVKEKLKASNTSHYGWNNIKEPWVRPHQSIKITSLGNLKALAYTGDKRAIKIMAEALTGASLDDRKLISEASYEIHRPELTSALQKARGKDRSPIVCTNIENALQKHRTLEKSQKKDTISKKTLKELREISSGNDAQESAIAIENLRERSKDWVKDILKILDEGPIHAKRSAIQYLASEDSPIVNKKLMKYKDHENVGLRRQIRESLLDRGIDIDKDKNEELQKFLRSDDSGLKMMGLSMIQGLELSVQDKDEFFGIIIGLNLFDKDKNVRAKARSVFYKNAPKELKDKVKKIWKANYRNISNEQKNTAILEDVLTELGSSNISLKDLCLIALKSENYAYATVENFGNTNEDCLDLAISFLESTTYTINLKDSICQMGKRAVQPLIELLKNERIRVRSGAIQILGRIGDPASVKPLIETLKDVSPDMRHCSIKAIRKLGDKKAIIPLTHLITDSYHYNRKETVDTLEELGWLAETNEENLDCLVANKNWELIINLGDSAVEKLIFLLDDYDSDIQQQATYCLGKIGNKRAFEPLIQALQNGRNEAQTIVALGEIGDKRAFDILVEIITADDTGVSSTYAERIWLSSTAMRALGMLGDERAFKILMEKLNDLYPYLHHTDFEYYEAAVEGLGNLGDKRAVPSLIEILRDSNGEDERDRLQYHATIALQKIAKENLKGKEKDNVLKFLKSDDSGMVMIGASMMKGVLKE